MLRPCVHLFKLFSATDSSGISPVNKGTHPLFILLWARQPWIQFNDDSGFEQRACRRTFHGLGRLEIGLLDQRCTRCIEEGVLRRNILGARVTTLLPSEDSKFLRSSQMRCRSESNCLVCCMRYFRTSATYGSFMFSLLGRHLGILFPGTHSRHFQQFAVSSSS